MESTERSLEGSSVLCVDDHEDTLELLRIMLARRGANVTTCTSAEAAIGILTNERFDAVISDLTMPPGLGGYDLAHALRKMEDQDLARRPTPTIAVSGDALRPSRKRRFSDFQVYMPKPVDQARLVYVVERLIEADGEAVKLGSLGSWEAEEATAAAVIATGVAATATDAAAEATSAAIDATSAAALATTAAAKAKDTAKAAEVSAAAASSNAPC